MKKGMAVPKLAPRNALSIIQAGLHRESGIRTGRERNTPLYEGWFNGTDVDLDVANVASEVSHGMSIRHSRLASTEFGYPKRPLDRARDPCGQSQELEITRGRRISLLRPFGRGVDLRYDPGYLPFL